MNSNKIMTKLFIIFHISLWIFALSGGISGQSEIINILIGSILILLNIIFGIGLLCEIKIIYPGPL